MDIGAITSALSGIKQATDIAKIIKDSSSSLEEAEIKLKLADLISALADAKVEIANIKEAVTEKDEEITRLKGVIETSDKLVWESPYYFLINEEEVKDGPYCQKCYDSQRKFIRLQSGGEKGTWKCHECKNFFVDNDYISSSHDTGIW
ncbi:MAG: hypothetical protein Q3M24_12795 [Candidatus Electrothrix aestuarii]|uniref:Uncharacterized protein n=1 Tax=Candidatus Electrothrix aestuarii TaxID=3062594 RepID=A0AAU8LPH4_9BACT|nr:hypothetical protein [Candidatus Electrothrix aestuarii]